jgi:hypothetical protein
MRELDEETLGETLEHSASDENRGLSHDVAGANPNVVEDMSKNSHPRTVAWKVSRMESGARAVLTIGTGPQAQEIFPPD